jgi:hypothetical protein
MLVKLTTDERLRYYYAASIAGNGDDDCNIKFQKCKFELEDIRKIMLKNLI